MEFRELVSKRRSVRAFQPREIEKAKLDAILRCVQAAPSAGNLQGYEVLVVTSPRTKRALAKAALGQEFLDEAPVVLVFLGDAERSASRYGARGRDLYSLQDATIACAYAQLAARAEGLGTCWIGAFQDEEVSRVLGVPPGLRPVAVLPVGHAAEEGLATSRRSLDDLVRWEEPAG